MWLNIYLGGKGTETQTAIGPPRATGATRSTSRKGSLATEAEPKLSQRGPRSTVFTRPMISHTYHASVNLTVHSKGPAGS